MGKKLLLIGGGGHCHSILDSILSSGLYAQIGVVAKDPENFGELSGDHYIAPFLIGVDKDLPWLFDEGWKCAFITLGSVGNTKGRRTLHTCLTKIGFELPIIIDSSAIVSSRAEIAAGVFVGKSAVVNTGCQIGTEAIINTGAIIEHDCHIGDFVHVSPGAVLCGQVFIGNDSHVGAGCVVRQGITIGENTLIGAGSVVVKDIADNVKAYGNPCRTVK